MILVICSAESPLFPSFQSEEKQDQHPEFLTIGSPCHFAETGCVALGME